MDGSGSSIDVVIPIGKSKIDYLDLRYTLRGIEKNLKGYRNIYLVGEKPKWVKNIIHIPQADNPKKEFKEFNIYNKIVRICNEADCTEDFFFMNDDHILLSEVSAIDYPYYCRGDISEAMKLNTSNYRATLNHTRKYLRGLGLEELHFDVHCPIVYNKKDFLKAFEPVDWSKAWGYGIKSIYSQVNTKHFKPFRDCKIINDLTIPQIENKLLERHVMSCDDGGMKENLINYLNRTLNFKSRYEN